MPEKHKGNEKHTKRSRAVRMSPEQRQQQLLVCALSAFAEKGFGEASHSDLAERANVSVPTTFHYFPSRECLINAVIGEVTRFLIEDFVEVRILNPAEATSISVGEMLMAFADAIDEKPDYIRIWMQWSSNVQGPAWKEYTEFQRRVLKTLKILLLRGRRDGSLHPKLDCEIASKVILACATMVAHMKFDHSSRQDIQRAVDSIVAGYLEGYRES